PYATYRGQAATEGDLPAQSEVGRAFAALRSAPAPAVPSGLSAETLEAVSRHLHSGPPSSAQEVADACGISRVTARRYLEHLASSGVLARRQRHRGSGRPEIEYSWRG